MTANIKIFEQGPGQWPMYLVSEDWTEAAAVIVDCDRIHVGRAGRANFMYGRKGPSMDVTAIPADAVIQICGDDQ